MNSRWTHQVIGGLPPVGGEVTILGEVLVESAVWMGIGTNIDSISSLAISWCFASECYV